MVRKRWIIPAALFVAGALALAAPAAGGETRVFELSDGTTVVGTVTAFRDGVYTVSSPSLGTLRIPESGILVMRKRTAQGSSGKTGGMDVESLQRMILADPRFGRSLERLQEDPSVRRMLEDPALRSALQSGDYEALMQRPEFQRLLDHPEVRNMTREILRQMQ